MSESRRPRRRQDPSRRDKLVAAAGRVIAREGVSATTTRLIAAEADVPLGMLHYWFEGKDALLRAVLEDVVHQLQAAATETHAAAGTGERGDMLAAFRAAWRVVAEDDPGRQISLYELTTTALRDEDLAALARTQYELYRKTASNTVAPWLDRIPADLPGGHQALARLVAVVFDGVTLAWLADPEGSRPDEVFRLLSYVLEHAPADAQGVGEEPASG